MSRAAGFERYAPGNPPAQGFAELAEYVYRELTAVAALLNALADGQIEVSTAAPTKLKHGMIRLADGTAWNPGSGRGVYWYDSVAAAWKLLG